MSIVSENNAVTISKEEYASLIKKEASYDMFKGKLEKQVKDGMYITDLERMLFDVKEQENDDELF